MSSMNSKLTVIFSDEVENDNSCNGCMRRISAPFYSCGECRFFLHKNYAELPGEKGEPRQKHMLTLTKNYELGYLHGFSYK